MDKNAYAWDASSRTMPTAVLVLLVLFLLGRFGSAAASQGHDAAPGTLEHAAQRTPDDETAAEALFRVAETDEQQGAFASAIDHHRACIAAAPNSRWAATASERVDWLLARSEGEFVPLSRLERFRRDPALAADSAAVDELAREVETFPPGTVRVEARMLVAEAWLGRMARPQDALAELRRVAGDPSADPLTASLAERQLVEALVAGDRTREAASEAHAHANLLDGAFIRKIDQIARRKWVQRGATATLAAFVGLATLSLFRARRRRALRSAARALRSVAPVAVAFVAFVAVAGGTLASRYESGNARPFLLFGAAALPLVLLAAAWSAVGSARPMARGSRAVFCGVTLLAAAFVLLDVVSPDYLEGFGL
jgi:hypothetical protein